MNIRIKTFALLAVLFSINPLAWLHAEEIPVDTVIKIVSDFESRIVVEEFHCEVWHEPFTRNGDVWAPVAETRSLATIPDPAETGNIKVTSDVRFAPLENKYHVCMGYLAKARMEADGPLKYTFNKSGFSNDGTEFRTQVRGFVVQTRKEAEEALGADSPGGWWKATGIVSVAGDEIVHVQKKGFFPVHGRQSGLAWVTPMVTPFHEPPQKLSELLRIKKDSNDFIAARTHNSDVIEIFYSVVDSNPTSYSLRIFYDTARGRVVRYEWGGCLECKEYLWDDWYPTTIAFLNYPDNESPIPSEVSLVDYPWKPKEGPPKVANGTRWIYSDAKLNPAVGDDAFQVEFAAGTEVTDYANSMIYVVGSGIPNEKEAVERFISAHELGDSQSDEATVQSIGPFRWAIMLVNVIVFGLLILWFLKFSKKSKISVLLTFALVNVAAAAPPQPEEKRQCGQLACMSILGLYGHKVSVPLVEESLKPTKGGISLAQISTFLSTYGLQPDARENVRLHQLNNAINGGVTAIVPVKTPDGFMHYLIAAKRPGDKKPMIFDPLRFVQPLETVLTESDMKETGGIVLFIRRREKAQTPKTSLEFNPANIDIGMFVIDGPDRDKPLQLLAKLTNNSKYPQAVVSVETSCGCTSSKWDAGIVPAKSSVNIPVNISKLGWGEGFNKRSLQVTTALGEKCIVNVSGTGVMKSIKAQKIRASKTRLSFRVNAETMVKDDSDAALPTQSIVVFGDQKSLNRLKVKTSEKWIRVSVVPIGGDTSSQIRRLVNVSVVPDDETRIRLRMPNVTMTAKVMMYTNAEDSPVVTQVALRRDALFSITPSRAQSSPSEETIFRISPVTPLPKQTFDLKEISIIPLGEFVIHKNETKAGECSFSIQSKANNNPGTYVVTVIVDSGTFQDKLIGILTVKETP